MNSNIISSDMAAPNQLSHANLIHWPDEWVSARAVTKRFGFCERTLRAYVTRGMPKYLIGKRQMRFVLREVHDWLLREGALRFAAIGLANTVRASTQPQSNDVRSISVNVPPNLQITNTTARRNRKPH